MSPEAKLKDMEDCDLHDREFKTAVMKKLRYEKTQKGSLISSGIKSVNERSALPKRLKL